MSFFDKKSLWAHRRIANFVVNIYDVTKDGKYVLVFEGPSDPWASALLSRLWTAAELVHDFTPQVQDTRWARLLHGESPLAEDNPNTQG